MFFNLIRPHSLLFITLFFTGALSDRYSHAGEAAALAEVFAKPIARLIFVVSGSEKAALFMRDITHSPTVRRTDTAYNEFRQALNWEDSHELRSVFAQKISQIEGEFGIYRKSIEKEALITANELLTEVEILELRKIVTRTLGEDETLAKLVTRTKAAIERKIPKVQTDRLRLVDGDPGFDGKVPFLPNMSESLALDVTRLDRRHKNFFRVFRKRVNDYTHFGKALIFTEGEWKSIFLDVGKQFTVNDWAMIRRWNLILDALTPKKKLELRLFARSQVTRQIETRFNLLTQEASNLHQTGEMSDQIWIAKRLAVATDKELGIGLTAFDIAAEKTMLASISKCRKLGGTSDGTFAQNGLINDLEAIIDGQLGKKANLQSALDKAKAKIAGLEFDLVTAKKSKTLEAYKIDEIRVTIASTHRDFDRIISLQRENEVALEISISKLSQAYSDFYEAYYLLPVFVDARNGKIAGQVMTPIPFPDVLIPTQLELEAWAPISDRALQNSIPQFIKKDLHLFATTRVGATRKFIHELDDAFNEIHGEPFTKSALGIEYQEFARNFFKDFAFAFLKRALPYGAVTGTTAAAMAEKFADQAVSKWIKSILGLKTEKPAKDIRDTPDTDPIVTPEPDEKPSTHEKTAKKQIPGTGSPAPIVINPPSINPRKPKSPFHPVPIED